MAFQSVAIDGPSGAGKSTLAKMLAKDLGFLYVDTGAIYRTVGLYVFRNHVASTDREGVVALLPEIQIEMGYCDDGMQHMYLNGEDVTKEIRRHEISQYASDVSAIPQVRAFLLDMQRSFAEKGNVIMDGRDIGTVVLPQADVKLYLTADEVDRAMRRHAELLVLGMDVTFETVLSDLRVRDINDSSRTTAPLRQAEDAILVNTTGNSLEKSFGVLREIIREKLEA